MDAESTGMNRTTKVKESVFNYLVFTDFAPIVNYVQNNTKIRVLWSFY